MTFDFHPIDTASWSDFETLMESKGSPHNCWCTAWIDVEKKNQKAEKSEKKASIKARVEKNIPVGLLAYFKDEPIGWCALAPRETYRPLGGDETKEQVWSIVCFFIKRDFRRQGLSSVFLKEAIKFARDHGAKFIEGYPVAKDSPSYRFMGFQPVFEKADFKFIKKAGTRRNVMVRDLT
ncbi:MAG: GNAT family N-acetyltransferase [Rhizobiales bacterium]|nr:GNAT family N-acetyltransferase [Hyphomicrobiales bacterium]